MPSPTIQAIFVVLFASLVLLWVRNPRRRLPPGPRGLPILGNVIGLRKEYQWRHWAKYKDSYGPVSSLCIMGQPIIILNSLKACEDLLEKRSAVYSGRPVSQFAGEMIGWNLQMILSPYGDRFRSMRKLVARHIGTNAGIAQFRPAQELEARYLLARVCENPESFLKDIRISVAAIFLKMSYGYSIERNKPDPLLTVLDTAAHEFYVATTPGAWLVDTFPSLRHIPAWMPGASFKKVAEKYRHTNLEQTYRPLDHVKRRLLDKTAVPSFTSALLQSELSSLDMETLPFAATSLFGGGTDTVVATTSTFVLAMVLFPDVQRKAQEEIDRVVGSSRLPNFDDREHLPYLAALYKELLRWHVIGPLGIPHSTTEDDWYGDYFIPKGSLVMTNLWQIANDPEIYDDPSAFRPERFLGAQSALDPHTFVFGFGRRGCPGQALAGATVYAFMSASLATLKFEPAPECPPSPEFISGTVSHPKPFKCNIKPRSPSALETIRAVNAEHPPEPASQF
ncbi:cytochrome P450 [Multifurca ochricompacta]|uniref:Cytochrome P450 n=1 Tax=Multifurca ochricompacta TaxID=376703 RepID=A0AAD4M1L0_9AGAM|nr:cytochrome P450 [Multifurca ochricompacta]